MIPGTTIIRGVIIAFGTMNCENETGIQTSTEYPAIIEFKPMKKNN
jgi:hypothetical protein